MLERGLRRPRRSIVRTLANGITREDVDEIAEDQLVTRLVGLHGDSIREDGPSTVVIRRRRRRRANLRTYRIAQEATALDRHGMEALMASLAAVDPALFAPRRSPTNAELEREWQMIDRADALRLAAHELDRASVKASEGLACLKPLRASGMPPPPPGVRYLDLRSISTMRMGLTGFEHGGLLGRQVTPGSPGSGSRFVWHPLCMQSTTRRGTTAASRRPDRLDRQVRIESLLAETGRRVVPIRRRFVQQGRGNETRPGPLASFLTAHDERGLDAYLMVHAMASAHPWNCRLPSDAWVGALGLDETASMASARTAVSKIMGRLEKRGLVARVRSARLSDVVLLREDGFTAEGDRQPYERPLTKDDPWLQFPHTYWTEKHHLNLSLPAKVMLIIALSLNDGFWLPYEFAPRWYGASSDSAEHGLRELRAVGLLGIESTWVQAPRSPTGWTERLLYTLQGSFSTAERKKAARIRTRVTEAKVVDEPLAPVVPIQIPTPEEFLFGKGSA